MVIATMQALQWLISRAELSGSRGRARLFMREEPKDSGYDWSIFTDDQSFKEQALEQANNIVSLDKRFKLIQRNNNAYTLHSRELGIDVNICPLPIKQIRNLAWALIETGMSKDDAWVEAHARFQRQPTR